MQTSKNRYWTFEFYPPKGAKKKEKRRFFQEIIKKMDELHLKYTVSPLHDQDKNPDGSKKEPHWHCMAVWDGPTTYNNAVDVLGSIAANGYIQSVVSARGLYRYFIHADNPEKFQYSDEERTHGGGFNPADLLSETDKRQVQLTVCKIIRDLHIYEFADLVELLSGSGMLVEWTVVAGNVNFFKTYLNSRRHSTLRDMTIQQEGEKKERSISRIATFQEAES